MHLFIKPPFKLDMHISSTLRNFAKLIISTSVVITSGSKKAVFLQAIERTGLKRKHGTD